MELTKDNTLQLRKIFAESSHEEVKRKIDKFEEIMTYYRCAILEVETKLKVLNEQFSLEKERNPIESIKSRVKSLSSIMEKLDRKDLEFNVSALTEDLKDIAGVRVICSFVDDIYMIAECLGKQDDINVVEVKDYIKNPKGNGYRSLHMIIEIPIFLQQGKQTMKVEIQLRTIAMEFWANLEHKLRYKKNLSEELEKKTSEELRICAEMSAELDSKMQNIKNIINE